MNKLLAWALCCGLLIGLAAAPAQGAQDPYRIGPHDVLEIVVWREDRISRNDVLVRPDGRISLPLVDDIVAAGLTPMELKQVIAKTVARFVELPKVYVIVREPRSFFFSVLGSVNKPGRHSLPGPTTVLQGLAIAEGFNEWAHKDDIVILRGQGKEQSRLTFSYSDVVSGKNQSQNVLLMPGDTIIVP